MLKEGEYCTAARQQQIRDLRDVIAREVHVTQLGLGAIIELSQAQPQQTEAEVGNTNARYDYSLGSFRAEISDGTTVTLV